MVRALRLDIGTGSDNATWQALVGVGYRDGGGEPLLAAPSLSYDVSDKGEDANKRISGPVSERQM